MARKTARTKRPVVKRRQKGSLSERALGLALGQFRRRATDLVLDYVATGRLNQKIKCTVLQLKADVDSWMPGQGTRTFVRQCQRRKRTWA